MGKLTVEQVVEAIGIPANEWPGRCYEIACEMLKAGLVKDGKAQYGHFFGFIHPKAKCFGGRTFTHHGWIKKDWLIIDPTRWVFENVDPYIYYGSAEDPDYDFGSNRLKMSMLRPCPKFDKSAESHLIPESIRSFCKMMMGSKKREASINQIIWLANLPLQILEDKAEPIYRWIAYDVGLPAFIPLDNRLEILGE